MLAPNTLLQSRYLAAKAIGEGGMGTVYHATDQRLGNVVALKEAHFSEDYLRAAFEREARLLANLRHPALPKVMDHFSEGEKQYLVMEFITGDDLASLLSKQGTPFPPQRVLVWMDQILDALEYLHRNTPPIIHRDIKPANLKLTADDRIVLLDFGLAKGAAGQMTLVHANKSVVGYTPNYAPLEQAQATGTDARSDLYSLAATFYNLTTRIIPPDAMTRLVAMTRGLPDPLRPLHELNRDVPLTVSNVIANAMSVEREQRPTSAADMRRQLRAANRSQPFTAQQGAGMPTAPNAHFNNGNQRPPLSLHDARTMPLSPANYTAAQSRQPQRTSRAIFWALGGASALTIAVVVAITAFALSVMRGSNPANSNSVVNTTNTNAGNNLVNNARESRQTPAPVIRDSTWTGTLEDGTPLSCEFTADNQFFCSTQGTANDNNSGSWQLTDSRISLRLSNGGGTFSGTVQGDEMRLQGRETSQAPPQTIILRRRN